ncbi:hypothetical protein GGQ59_001893 [Parvularcula dongshanensis]|uniref:Uncharacterized protein n=1 Tax=Parvularcula dongshanensis TaxID=1173995 RepID=A0A840I5C4_9PROT|nr:hypothetical protein [Parvularcula dongshanensis]
MGTAGRGLVCRDERRRLYARRGPHAGRRLLAAWPRHCGFLARCAQGRGAATAVRPRSRDASLRAEPDGHGAAARGARDRACSGALPGDRRLRRERDAAARRFPARRAHRAATPDAARSLQWRPLLGACRSKLRPALAPRLSRADGERAGRGAAAAGPDRRAPRGAGGDARDHVEPGIVGRREAVRRHDRRLRRRVRRGVLAVLGQGQVPLLDRERRLDVGERSRRGRAAQPPNGRVLRPGGRGGDGHGRRRLHRHGRGADALAQLALSLRQELARPPHRRVPDGGDRDANGHAPLRAADRQVLWSPVAVAFDGVTFEAGSR